MDADDPSAIVDLASIGATLVGWRDGPLENWHAAPDSRIGDTDLMLAAVATTRLVRHEMAVHPAEVVFPRLQGVLADLDRRLPDGRSMAEIAPSRVEACRHVDHVSAAVRRWTALACEIGPDLAVGVLACAAGWRARGWWGTPWWPGRVEAFVNGLGQQDRRALLSGHAVDGAQLEAMLRDGPDLMDVELVRTCLRAGLGVVTVADEPLVGRWFRRFALLVEPDTPADVHRRALRDLVEDGGAP